MAYLLVLGRRYIALEDSDVLVLEGKDHHIELLMGEIGAIIFPYNDMPGGLVEHLHLLFYEPAQKLVSLVLAELLALLFEPGLVYKVLLECQNCFFGHKFNCVFGHICALNIEFQVGEVELGEVIGLFELLVVLGIFILVDIV